MIAIEKVYILAFSENIEKKKQLFQSRLKVIALAENALVEVIEIPDKDKIYEVLKQEGYQLLEGWTTDDDPSTTEEALCFAIGHWKVWQNAKAGNHKTIMVLEENFQATSHHYNVLNTVHPWHLLYLGRYTNDSDTTFETGGLVKPGYSNGSFAYIMNAAGIDKVLASGFNKKIISVSEFLTAAHGAHPQKEILSSFTSGLIALAPMKNFIEQDDSWPALLQSMREQMDYKPLHPHLYPTSGADENEWVKKYINPQLVQQEFDLMCDEPIDNVYSFPLFTPLFCKEVIEESEHFGEWSNHREKENASIDIKLDSFGFNDIYAAMLKKFLYPLITHKYQLEGEGWKNLNSQNFIVRYIAEVQGHLGLHNDGSYLSLIVTLNTEYEGGGTFFPKYKKLIKPDKVGYASIHPGLVGYLHGARPITSGKRYILASFFFMGSRPFADGAY